MIICFNQYMLLTNIYLIHVLTNDYILLTNDYILLINDYMLLTNICFNQYMLLTNAINQCY